MSEPEALSLNYKRTDSIALPQSAAETRFAIRTSDWERLKRNVAKCDHTDWLDFSGWSFCCFGISGSAFLSIIPLNLSEKVPAWMLPLYLCVGLFASVIGLALWAINQRLVKDRTTRLAEVRLDMTDIERGFQ